jgi:beta-fructofuranosidase
MGFADHTPDGRFGGFVMDPEPVEVGEDGLLRVLRQDKAAE